MSFFISLGRIVGFFAVLSALCFISIEPAFCLDENVTDKDKRVSFEFHNQPMAEVANKISEQLNYKVFMDDELAAMPVSGKFIDVTLDDFFSRRIFRGKNIAIMFDDKEHVVRISSLGKKGRMTEYNRTDRVTTERTLDGFDRLELEVLPGLKRRDVATAVSDVDPLDREVAPGVKRRDAVTAISDVDPLDREVIPGVKRRDAVTAVSDIDPLDREVHPGVKRRDVIQPGSR